MTYSDGNLSDVISKGVAAIVIARIEEVSKDDETDDVASGTLRITVLRELTKDRFHAGPEVLFGYQQHVIAGVRAKMGKQGYNGVDIAPGKHLLAALAPVLTEKDAPRGPVAPLSVAPLTGPDDPFAAGVLGALALEGATDPASRLRLAREGLSSPLPFLPGYCHYAIGRLHRIPREDAAALEAALLSDPARSPLDRARAEATLELELWTPDAPEDATNRRIVQVFVTAVASGDPELRGTLVAALHRMLEGDEPEKGQYRAELMKGVQIANRASLLAALSGLAHDADRGAEARWLSAFFGK